ncbi:MAG: 2-hydroxyglutaryl-CoA dehydratase [Proteobacteria bacterium]|nr:2-hydroxyglutaryl-CoA dehydratase [Pseudomonadota bacterium]
MKERGTGPLAAGVDIGAATAKAVIIDGAGRVLSWAVIPTGHDVVRAGKAVYERALDGAFQSPMYVVSTGYGRRAVSFADRAVTEIICHAAGAHAAIPGTRTVIDIGGQDSKVIALDETGAVSNFVMNDKCAAGTGRFLEVMAGVLELDLSELGPVSLAGPNPCSISSTCAIFAETEVVSLRADGRSREDILAGLHKAMAHRVAIMGRAVGFREPVLFTGGVARNEGIKKALEKEIGLTIEAPEHPQIIGALGAAIIARAEMERSKSK